MFLRFVLVVLFALLLVLFGVFLEIVNRGGYVFEDHKREASYVGIGLILAIIVGLLLTIGV